MVNETKFWDEIRKDLPRYKKRKPRVVPAFTIQALQVTLQYSKRYIYMN